MKQNENKLLVVLLGLIAFLLLGAGYYYVIIPKGEARTQKTNSINQLEVENSALENQVATLSVGSPDETNDFELRNKLPMNRELDNLLHTINEVELMSESQIVSIAFNNYDEEVSQSIFASQKDEEEADVEAEEKVDVDTDTEVEDAEVDDEVDETKPVTPIDTELLPDELKLISLNIVLSVLDYDHLLKFLNEVEEVERVIRIDSVNFSKSGEEKMAQENPDERITVSVQLTTFYSEEVGS